MKPKTSYLTNRELLAAIHQSKLSYCSFVERAHGAFDAIVSDVDEITPELIEATRLKRSRTLPKPHPDPETIPVESLVFRVMTDAHIPIIERYKAKKLVPAKTCFPPFIHVVMTADGPVEVLRSHWRGGLANGEFSNDHGRTSDRLALAYTLLVERYGRRPNWRNYSYRDEMESFAILQLVEGGLKFNEAKSDNPFAYLTTIVSNAFVRTFNKEKRVQEIRDDLIEEAGMTPSFARQARDLGQQPPA